MKSIFNEKLSIIILIIIAIVGVFALCGYWFIWPIAILAGSNFLLSIWTVYKIRKDGKKKNETRL